MGTKFVIEYHMVEGRMVGRECDSKEHMEKLVNGFAASRKGVHDYTVTQEDTGQDVRVVIPLEQVKVLRSYAVEEGASEEVEA